MGCGPKEDGAGGQQSAQHGTEQQIRDIATRHGIPERIFFALGILESGLNPKAQDIIYGGSPLYLQMARSAFGHSYAALGLADNPNRESIATQAEAMAKKITAHLKAHDLQLAANPTSLKQKFDWLWELARLQREGDIVNNNTRKVFVHELAAVLNSDQYVPIAGTEEVLSQKAESPNIDLSKLPQNSGDMTISYSSAEIAAARYFNNDNIPSTLKNEPKHINIVHCPIATSKCLEIFKSEPVDQAAKIGGHYLIPGDDSIIEKPIQLTYHDQPVIKTGGNGETMLELDAITIILAGKSGHYRAGKRFQANPTWFTDYQLRQMAGILDQVCRVIHPPADNPTAFNECKTPGAASDLAPRFYVRRANEEFKWGQIPDFNKSIVWRFLQDPGSMTGGVSVNHRADGGLYVARKPIELDIELPIGTKVLRVDYAARCPDDKIVWQIARRDAIESGTNERVSLNLFGKGPNDNGEHFLRLLATDINGKLLGWQTTRLTVTGFRKDFTHQPSPELCQ